MRGYNRWGNKKRGILEDEFRRKKLKETGLIQIGERNEGWDILEE